MTSEDSDTIRNTDCDSMNDETRDAIHTERISLRCVQADDIPALAKL